MHRTIRMLLLTLLLAALFVPFGGSVVLAHGHEHVGDYELVIGFINEPAYQGEPNGLDLRVVNTQTDEPVLGLHETLRAEIIFGSQQRELELRPRWGREGSYVADVLPTESGDYTFRIHGDIEGTPVDISMTGGPDTFSTVQPKSDVAFPATNTVEMTTAAQAAQAAQTALLVGVAGVVFGVIGTIVGLIGLRARHSNDAPVNAQTRQA